jgi:ATP synthase protein I
MMGAEAGPPCRWSRWASRLVFASVKEPAVIVLFGSFLVVHLLPVWWLHRVSDQAMKR